jgi:hypothetical protein
MKEFIEKLIGRLEEARDWYSSAQLVYCHNPVYVESFINREAAMNLAIEIVNQLAEEYKDGWIPVSERLPKANIVVWVYLKKCYKDKTYYSYDEAYVNEKGYWADEFGLVWGTVLAWQPLPAPYEYKEVNK